MTVVIVNNLSGDEILRTVIDDPDEEYIEDETIKHIEEMNPFNLVSGIIKDNVLSDKNTIHYTVIRKSTGWMTHCVVYETRSGLAIFDRYIIDPNRTSNDLHKNIMNKKLSEQSDILDKLLVLTSENDTVNIIEYNDNGNLLTYLPYILGIRDLIYEDCLYDVNYEDNRIKIPNTPFTKLTNANYEYSITVSDKCRITLMESRITFDRQDDFGNVPVYVDGTSSFNVISDIIMTKVNRVNENASIDDIILYITMLYDDENGNLLRETLNDVSIKKILNNASSDSSLLKLLSNAINRKVLYVCKLLIYI